MKKIMLTAIALVLGAMAFAQQPEGTAISETKAVNPDGSETTTTVYQTDKLQLNKRRDNWFLGIGVGGQVFHGENDWRMRFGDLLSPTFDLSIGKWVTPAVAVDLTFSPAIFKGLYYMHQTPDGGWEYAAEDRHFATSEKYSPRNPLEGGYQYYKQRGTYMNLYARVIFDGMTVLKGYDPDRKFTFMPFIGGGWLQGLSSKEGAAEDSNRARYACSPSFNGGIIFDLKVSPAWSLNLTARAALTGDNFDGEFTYNNPDEGCGGVTVGATYRISRKKDWNYTTNTHSYKNNDALLAAAAAELAAANAEIEKILAERDAKIKELEKQADVHNTKDAISPYYVSFTLDKVDVVDREKINLAVVAKIMKANPEATYTISGYADKQTGTSKRNQWLSEHRAENVMKVLVDEFGVNPAQLKTSSFGGVDIMYYNDNALTRCALITVDE